MTGRTYTETKGGDQKISFRCSKRYKTYPTPVVGSLTTQVLFQAETYQAEAHNDTHGKSGPIKVSFAKDHINVTEDFLEVAAAYDRDRGPSNDLNAFHYCDKYAVRVSIYLSG